MSNCLGSANVHTSRGFYLKILHTRFGSVGSDAISLTVSNLVY